jgi:uncharacterized protein (TIGR00369 family)
MSDPTEHAEALARFTAFIENKIPFNRLLGMRVRTLTRGRAVVEIPFRADLIGDIFRPALHGGVVSALIDATGGAAAFTMIERVDRVSTVDMRVDYLRPGAERALFAEAEVLRMGNRVTVVQVRVHQGDLAQPIAIGSCVYNVRRNVGPYVDRRGTTEA